jgi:hypothetical protein
MAKSLLSIKTKKKQKVSKSETYLVNLKYLGEEPDSTKLKTQADWAKAFNWYHSMCSREEARQYLKDYFANDKVVLKKITKIPDAHMPYTAAWQCRIWKRIGKPIDGESLERVHKWIDEASSYAKEDKPKEDKPERPTIQDRMKEKISELIGDIEVLYDAEMPVDLYSFLQKREVPAMYTGRIVEYYKPILEEMKLAAAGEIEGYESYTKKWLRDRVDMLQKIIDDAQRYGGNVKKARAPRKKKAPTAEKLLKHFTYQKESNEYKLQSIDPAKILGAQELWTFNTKYKTLTVFRARGPAGLSVRRTTIDGYDVDASVTKTLRKPDEVLKKVLTGGKLVLRKLMDELKTKQAKTADRINENVILVKVA